MIHAIQKFDITLFTWLLNIRFYPLLAQICRYLSKTGDGHLYAVLIVALYLINGYPDPTLQALLLALLIERPLYFVLKNTCRRDRPEAALEHFASLVAPSDKFSFPSGHTSAAFLVATIISYYLPLMAVIVLPWAALVGLSRVILGVHFPTDIFMGIFLGIATAIISIDITSL